MKIPKDFDVEGKAPPKCESGTSYMDNPGVKPYESPIPDTPGENATNSTEPESMSKSQVPGGVKKGSGYTS